MVSCLALPQGVAEADQCAQVALVSDWLREERWAIFVSALKNANENKRKTRGGYEAIDG
ncbi:hypothetical protein predicted by Glimmer/Critica [Acetobacter senegalensis]|uniref:Uncharacterized protein n=1 Tax=Acetobacter senegalensis TaxID=446692 RepID=A0A0U5EWQ9_9PROT|nr:hypothetical protein predicted by Glimmer/Critica [Acetobacter senegalensis]